MNTVRMTAIQCSCSRWVKLFTIGLAISWSLVGPIGLSADLPAEMLPCTVEPRARPTVLHVSPQSVQGSAWNDKDHRLYFTVFGAEPDDTQVQCLQADGTLSLWLDNAQGLSGIAFNRRGHLLGAQALGHRVIRYSVGKRGPRRVEVILEDPTLNQPNDVCEAPNGNLYITDPDFLHHSRSSVYLLRRGRELLQLITEMPLPNGLALSLDSKILYIADSHERRWRQYPLMDNGVTGPGTVFFDPKTEDQTPPNGMTIDSEGNLYLTGRGGVWVVDPEGNSLGLIPIPGFCSSVAFGDADGRTLFITSEHHVYRLRMRVTGGRWPRTEQPKIKGSPDKPDSTPTSGAP